MKINEISLIITLLFTGLMAGFFFSYTFSVNLGLQKLKDKEYLLAMQNINKEVLNPVFFSCFFGTLLFCIVSTLLSIDFSSPKFYVILLSALLYIFGVFVITGLQNVPLNNQLESFAIESANEEALQKMRTLFEAPWNYWNNVRTISSIISFLLLLTSIF